MKKQSLIKASLILGIAGILTRFLGLFFRWPLIMLIGDEGVGYYQMSFPLYMFFVAVASGVPVAISKMISEKNATKDIKGSFEVMKASSLLMLILGAGTSFVLFFFAKPIIEFLKWDMKSYYALIGISFAPIIISFMTIFRGFFQGHQNMTPSAISQVLEQIGRVVIGVGLAYLLLPRGIEFAAGGAAFGAAAGGLLGAIYLYIKYRQVKKSLGVRKVKSNPQVMTRLLKIAIPISLGATVGTVMNLIDSILVPQKLLEAGLTNQQATILYAQLTGKASVIVNIPLTLSVALCISLIPIIAENYVLKRHKDVENKIDMALKLSSVIAIPCVFGMYVMAGPIMSFIFPGKSEGIEILRYLSISIPFIIITQTTTSILQGVGCYIAPVINLFIGCLVKVLLTLFLVPIPGINIYGAVISTVGAYVVATVLNVITMKVKLGTRIKLYGNFLKPTVAAVTMMVVVVYGYNIIYRITTSNGVASLLSIFFGIIVYGIMIMVLKVFNVEEVKERFLRNR